MHLTCMKCDKPTVLPFVQRARERFFYGTALLCSLCYLAIFAFRMSGPFDQQQKFRLLLAVGAIVLMPIHRMGYKTLAVIGIIFTAQGHNVIMLFRPGEIFCGIIGVLVLAPIIKNYFMYDPRKQRLTMLLIAVFNIALIFTSAHFYVPATGLTINQEQLHRFFFSCVIAVISSLLCEMYFDYVRDLVYDEVKKHSEAVQQATADKEVFFATMSHEIRNPLQSLLGSVELLQPAPDPKASPHTEQECKLKVIIKNCCEVVLNLVSNILDVSKIEAQKLELSPVPSNLGENINKILRLSVGRAKAKGLKLTYVESSPIPPCLSFDPQRLHQVILNLISNAIKFTQKGQIVVTASWFPLLEEEAPRVIQRELSRSSWRSFFDPLQEFDLETQSKKMLKILQPHAFVPSSSTELDFRAETRPAARSSGECLNESANARLIDGGQVPTRHTGPLKKLRRDMRVGSELKLVGLGVSTHELNSSPGSPKATMKSSFAATKGLVKIEVMDTGIGISKEGISRLFQRYQQADASISRNYGGTGLGLWISRSILQKMGGDIRVKSKSGLGSNMIAVFRSEICPEVSVLSNAVDKKTVSLFRQEGIRGKKCIVVDDIPDNTYILQQLLTQNGLTVVTCNKAHEALETYKESRDVDLVVTDLRMPGMSGQTLIMEIRKHEAEAGRARTPIMVLTGEASREEKIACLGQYGADDYLLKPIKLQDLMSSVEGLLLGRKKARVGKRILVVDDDQMSRKLIVTLIKQGGDDAFGCATVTGACAEIDQNYGKYQGIFLDNQLPDGTGLDFMQHYTELVMSRGARPLQVVSMSGNAVQDQEKAYRGYCIHAFLEKPVSKKQLLDVLRTIK